MVFFVFSFVCWPADFLWLLSLHMVEKLQTLFFFFSFSCSGISPETTTEFGLPPIVQFSELLQTCVSLVTSAFEDAVGIPVFPPWELLVAISSSSL